MSQTAPMPNISTGPVTLRVLGTDVTLIDAIHETATAELGINLEFSILDGIEAQRRGALLPESFDIYDQWFHDVDLIWPAQSIKPIDIRRIQHWDMISNLPTFHRDQADKAKGCAPHRRLYVQENGGLGSEPSDYISMLPTVHNADSFAIIGENNVSPNHSWADLLAPEWKGRVAIHSDAAIGVIDLLLAFQALDELHFEDMGNLSVDEINQFIRHVRQYQLKQQFADFWTDKIQLPRASLNKSFLSTMWWSNYIGMKSRGETVTMCTPKEGYRGWFGGMSLSSRINSKEESAAYEYFNWWLSGSAGALMCRNGAYISTPEITKTYLSKNEWDFWYGGLPATDAIYDTQGSKIFEAGEKREGGAYSDRMSNVAIWNSVMDEHNFLVRLWNALRKSS